MRARRGGGEHDETRIGHEFWRGESSLQEEELAGDRCLFKGAI